MSNSPAHQAARKARHERRRRRRRANQKKPSYSRSSQPRHRRQDAHTTMEQAMMTFLGSPHSP